MSDALRSLFPFRNIDFPEPQKSKLHLPCPPNSCPLGPFRLTNFVQMRPKVFLADPASLPNCVIVALNRRSSEAPSHGNFGFLANCSRPCVVDKPSFINNMQSVGISTYNYFQTRITLINVDFLLSFLSPSVFHEGACQLVVSCRTTGCVLQSAAESLV